MCHYLSPDPLLGSRPRFDKGRRSRSVRLFRYVSLRFYAQAKGYYKAEGIDLTINPGGPNLLAENKLSINNSIELYISFKNFRLKVFSSSLIFIYNLSSFPK